MAITYPLTLPTHTGIRSVSFRARNAVAYSMSPFTFAGQAHVYPGQMWEADITLPPMKRGHAEEWNAFLMSLNGQAGTFLLGDPNGCAPRGSALSFKKNLLSFTEQFDQWSVNSDITVTSNTTTSPDGNAAADTLNKTAGTFSYLSRKGTTVAGQDYTASIYLKQGTAPETLIRLYKNVIEGSDLNFISIDWSDPDASGTAVGNGWYRFSVTTTAVDTGINMLIYPAGTGAGVIGTVFAWGAQLEEGSVATEYQPIANAYGPFVNGAGQTGSELIIDGASPNEDAYLKAGDYIQLGAASSARLHKVLADVATGDDGNATIDIWPALRTSPADNASVIIENAVGRFRLSENVSGWNADVAQYGITFSAREAV